MCRPTSLSTTLQERAVRTLAVPAAKQERHLGCHRKQIPQDGNYRRDAGASDGGHQVDV